MSQLEWKVVYPNLFELQIDSSNTLKIYKTLKGKWTGYWLFNGKVYRDTVVNFPTFDTAEKAAVHAINTVLAAAKNMQDKLWYGVELPKTTV